MDVCSKMPPESFSEGISFLLVNAYHTADTDRNGNSRIGKA
jgi:hypothetical protein